MPDFSPALIPCVLRRLTATEGAEPPSAFVSDPQANQLSYSPSSSSIFSDAAAGSPVQPSPRTATYEPEYVATASPREAVHSVRADASTASAAVSKPRAIVPISTLPGEATMLGNMPSATANPTFSLPGMRGLAGRQYIQVVELFPEHMPPVEDHDEADEVMDSSLHLPHTCGADAGDETAGCRAEAPPSSPPRPSHPAGAWSGRDADEVIHAAMEADVGQRLSSMADFLARLERQADLLEAEIDGAGAAADATEVGFAARQLGARAGMLGKLESQVEAALLQGRGDLHSLGDLSAQLASRSARGGAQCSVGGPTAATSPPRTTSSAAPHAGGRPGFASSSPRFNAAAPRGRPGVPRQPVGGVASAGALAAKTTPAKARGAGAGSLAGAGTASGRERQVAEATPPAAQIPPGPDYLAPPVCQQPLPDASSAIASPDAPCSAVAAESSASGLRDLPAGPPLHQAAPPQGQHSKPAKHGSGQRRKGSSVSAPRPHPLRAPTTHTGRVTRRAVSGAAEALQVRESHAAVRRSTLVSAGEALKVSAERQRQKHMDQRMARAEAALYRLLAHEPASIGERSGLQEQLPTSPHVRQAKSQAPPAPPSAASPRMPVASPVAACGHGEADASTDVQINAEAANDVAANPSATGGRRQELAALASAEQSLLDAMLGKID